MITLKELEELIAQRTISRALAAAPSYVARQNSLSATGMSSPAAPGGVYNPEGGFTPYFRAGDTAASLDVEPTGAELPDFYPGDVPPG